MLCTSDASWCVKAEWQKRQWRKGNAKVTGGDFLPSLSSEDLDLNFDVVSSLSEK